MNKRLQTKQLLSEWRKVLNEGLYDQDPEVLEEGLKDIGITLGTAAALFLGTNVNAQPPAEQTQQIINSLNTAPKNMSVEKALQIIGSAIVTYAQDKGLGNIPYKVKVAMAKVADQGIKELNEDEIKIVTEFLKYGMKLGKSLVKDAKEAHNAFKKKYPKGVESLNIENLNPYSMNDPEREKYEDFMAAARHVKSLIEPVKLFDSCYKSLSGSFEEIEGIGFEGVDDVAYRRIVDLDIKGAGKFHYQFDGSKPAP
jgi:hypothetical protein